MEVDSNGGDNPSVNEGEQVEYDFRSPQKQVEEPKKVNLEHNHDLIPTDSRHFTMNKKIRTPVKRRLEINDQVGIEVSRNYHSMVVEAGGYESLTFDERDARNYINRARRLRLGEDTDTFVWLFKSWLSCMSNNPPKTIITDQCRAMQNVIEIVFPQARHRWCLWHVMKKIPENLKGYAQYEPIKLAMQNAIYDCLTRDEFDEKWEEMLTKFNLYDNEWLEVLYHERHRWVPVYV
ncbi:protein FAR1-RELATED SEQUENCE 6-like [Camellia sinensis]|uniref:protein FAR1-RELATED SEQUENCE 6-like n=1 Tax=Camellia sinensis TaxID=4442 RepID=UPI001036ED14|nr:protein FAR1-RELATED SEQUENCE 6-like [Camellia sinensis]